MGVYVKEMPFPESCRDCVLAAGYDIPLACFAAYGIPARCSEFDECVLNGTKPDWCPLVEVATPHGRLIDESELLQYTESIDDSWGYTDMVSVYDINNVPTIIDAED